MNLGRILQTCSTIQCNCVPFAVVNNKPVHLPPINELSILDCTGELTKGSPPYDIVIATSDFHKFPMKPSGKLYTWGNRGKVFAEAKKSGFVLIDDRNGDYVFRPPRKFDRPQWNGERGNLLVYSGGGFGDDLSGTRYAPPLKEFGKVTFEARPEMRTLLESCSDYDNVINKGEDFDCDFVVSLEHLQRHFGGSAVPSLRRPIPGERFSGIAVAYQGHHVKYTSRRKHDPRQLAHFLGGRAVHCVQKHSNVEELVPALPEGIVDLGGSINDWLDTARIVGQMDFVASPDTSLFHLSSAMGVNTCVFLEERHASHYCVRGEWFSRYYPKTRLFWGSNCVAEAANYVKL